MRVLFVTHNIPRWENDAAGSFVLRLAVALQHAGASVDVIAPGAPGLPERDRVQGVSIHRVRYASDAHMTLAYDGTMAESVRRSWRARWCLLRLMYATRRATHRALDLAARERKPYAIVHVHWWFPSGLALWKGLRHGPPMIVTMHGSDVRLAQHTRPARSLMRGVLREAAARTAVSSWLAGLAARVANVPVQVSPMPVDTQLFQADEHARQRRDGVLFVGRLTAQKGLAELLRAFATPHLATTRLTVVGDGPDAPTLHALAKSLGVDARVSWRGVHAPAALAELYRGAVVVAMPSVEEGLGLVAVEAQLCGTPVVACDSGGLPDVVHPQHGGTLVPVGDVDALATALGSHVDNPAAAAALGDSAARYTRGRFAPNAVAAVYLALYDESAHHG